MAVKYSLALAAVLILSRCFSTPAPRMQQQQQYCAYCNERLPYCLFSDAHRSEISTLAEATQRCTSVQAASTLPTVKSADDWVILLNFMKNYSLPNVPLNAIDEGTRWVWGDNRRAIAMNGNYSKLGGILFFMTKPDQPKRIYVVCVAPCKAEWEVIPKQTGHPDNTFTMEATTLEDCKDTCDGQTFVDFYCVGIDIETRAGRISCYSVTRPGTLVDVKKSDEPHFTHYEIKRPNKNPQMCIGPVSIMQYRRFEQKRNVIDTGVELPLQPWATYIMACMVSCFLAIICYGFKLRCRTKDESEEESEE